MSADESSDFELPAEDDEVFKEMNDIDGFGQNFWAENEGTGDGENYLSNMLGSIDTKSDALKKMGTAVKAMSRMSFRRRSSVGGLLGGERSITTTNPDVGASQDAEHAMVGKGYSSSSLPLFRQRKRIAQMIEAWISASAGENLQRVVALKEMLEGSATLADEFFEVDKPVDADAASPTALPTEVSQFTFEENTETPKRARSPTAGSSGIKGYAYKLLDVLPSMKDTTNADTKISQAFEILCAAANAATDVPDANESVAKALDFALMTNWRPPLTTFFALRLVITLWPKQAMRYCRHVLLYCLNFQYRVVDAALVFVAEEALEGQLSEPAQWVEPALAVITHATSTGMSQDMLTLSVDILSYSFSCGGVPAFLQANGIKTIEQAIQAIDSAVVSPDATRRLLKLLNPQTMLSSSLRPISPEFGLNSSPPFGSPADSPPPQRTFPQKPELTDANYREILGTVYTVVSKYNGLGQIAPPEGSPTVPSDTQATESGVIDSQLCEEASVILYAVMQLAFDLCVEEHALSTFCSCITSSPQLWKCKGTIKAALFVILRYVQLHEANQKEETRITLTDDPVATNMPVDPTTTGANYKLSANITLHSTSSPQYYRAIMEASVLGVLSVAVRAFHNEDLEKCPHMGPVYKVIYTICLAEPAKQCFLRGCPGQDFEEDDTGDFTNTTRTTTSSTVDERGTPDPTALVPNLVYCLLKSNHVDHQFYVLNILYRICRGSQLEFCNQLLGPLPPGTVSVVSTSRKSHQLVSPHAPHSATKDVERDSSSVSGAFLRTLSRRIGTWKPRLLPAALGLCRELSRFLMVNGSSSYRISKSAAESYCSSLQSIVSTYRTEPNIVAAGTISLGHLCRCPQSLLTAAISTQAQFAASHHQEDLAAEVGTLHSAVSASHFVLGDPVAPLLKFALDHDLMDLAMQLRHGAFADIGEVSVIAAGSQTTPPVAPGDGTVAGHQLIFSHNMPAVVRNALGYLFACMSLSSAMISILLDEGALALMKAAAQSRDTNVPSAEATDTPRHSKLEVSTRSPAESAETSASVVIAPMEKSTRAKPTKPAVQSFSSVLLTREDRDFIKKQVARLEKLQRQAEEAKKPVPPPAPEVPVSPALAPTSLPTNAEAIHQLEILFAKQQAALLSDYEHRRVVELEDEILVRESLRQLFANKGMELTARVEGRNESLQRARQDLEERYLFGRQQIEQFQQDNFVEIMSYTNRSMQKKMTVVLRQRHTNNNNADSQSEGEFNSAAQRRYRRPTNTTDYSTFGPMGRSLHIADIPTMKDSPNDSGVGNQPQHQHQQQSPSVYNIEPLQIPPTVPSVESQLQKQLMAAQATLAVETSSALATMMETLQATHAAVERLKQQQEAMRRELLVPQRPTSAEGMGGSLVSRPQSSPTFRGASSNRSRRRRFETPPPHHHAKQDPQQQPYGDDAGIYEDRSPSPSDISPPPPLPPQRPHSHHHPTKTFRSQLARETVSPTDEDSLRIPTRPSTAKNAVVGGAASVARSPSKVNGNGRVAELQVSLLHGKEETTIVDLNRNYLGDGGLLALLPTLQQLPNLEVLLIDQNGLSGASVVPLMVEVLMAKPNFHHLSLNGNRDITPRVGRDLIAFVKAKPSMLVLDVEGTQIFVESGKILKRLLQERLANAKAHDIILAERDAPCKKEDAASPLVAAPS